MSSEERVWTPAEIVERYKRGERDFRDLEISDDSSEPAFRGATLDGAHFIGCFISADFGNASLRNCKFEGNVKGCIFDGADLSNADFSGTSIDSATFAGCNFDGTSFEGAWEQGSAYKKGELPIRLR